MAYLHNDVLDDGLQSISDATAMVLHLCHTAPLSFANVEAFTIANRNFLTAPIIDIADPVPGVGGGRQVAIPAIEDGVCTASGIATHWALVDIATSRLIASQVLSSSVTIVAGGLFHLTSFTIRIPSPA